jgi:hypothetical protein
LRLVAVVGRISPGTFRHGAARVRRWRKAQGLFRPT